MDISDEGPFIVETLGRTLRVVDKAGGDVARLGRVEDPQAQGYARFICDTLNLAAGDGIDWEELAHFIDIAPVDDYTGWIGTATSYLERLRRALGGVEGEGTQ